MIDVDKKEEQFFNCSCMPKILKKTATFWQNVNQAMLGVASDHTPTPSITFQCILSHA